LSAEVGFWQLLSLPPLLLTVLGVIGYFHGVLGHNAIAHLQHAIVRDASRIVSSRTVDTLIRPSLHNILTHGHADVVSIGFVLSLWSGSSAMATYVNTLSIAYGMRDVRSAIRARLLALLLYLGGVVAGIVGLPLLVMGPGALVRLLPRQDRAPASDTISALYWPAIALASVLVVAALYHLSVPARTRWRRDLPGAVLAMLLWLAFSELLRLYLTLLFHRASVYGSLAAPIAALLFFYLTGMAVLFGAELNAQIDRLWPTAETQRARRADPAVRRG
jgi:membrane protein